MIYTVTFNPALDYVVRVNDYTEGVVNRTDDEKIMPGGKGINVSVVLKNLGIENTALGFVSGFTGDVIEHILKNQGINIDFIRADNGFSRINIKLKTKTETEINGKGPQISKKSLDELIEKLKKLQDGDYLVLAGSIPKSIPDSIYCDIMKELSDKKINIIVDAEKDLLENVLPYRPFLIKPNHHELGAIFEKELKTKEEVFEYAKKLQERGARNVLVSMSKEGGVLVTEDARAMYSKPPRGQIVNTTGAGDSTVAGFIAEYIKSGDFEKSFIVGLCTGSASAFSETLAKKEEVEELYKQMQDNKILYL